MNSFERNIMNMEDSRIAKTLSLIKWVGEFSDQIIHVIVDGYHYYVPSERLKNFSDYFNTLFGSDEFIYSSANVVELHGIDPDIFENLLKYMYGQIIHITEENATRTYEAAAYLKIRDVMQKCIPILQGMMNSENCVEYLMIKGIEHAPGLLQKIVSTTSQNLLNVIASPAFLELSATQLVFLFESIRTDQAKTEIIFNAITRWILYDVTERRAYTTILLPLIQTHLISLSFLRTTIMGHAILTVDTAACRWLIQNFSISSVRLEVQDQPWSAFKADLPVPVQDKNIMIMDENLMLGFNVTSKVATRLANLKTSAKLNTVSYKGDVYMFGGVRSRTALRYVVEENDWHEMDFPTYSSSEAACVLGDSVYFTGGFFNDAGYNTVYRYDFNGEVVEQYPKMKVRRSMHGVAAKDNCIYACGGSAYSAGDLIQLRITERLDVREGKWCPLPGMRLEHGQCTAAIVSEYLYCSNIDNGLTERFNERQRRWEAIAQAPGSSGTIVSYEDTLYRIYEDGVAEYCPESDSWWQTAILKLKSPVAVSVQV